MEWTIFLVGKKRGFCHLQAFSDPKITLAGIIIIVRDGILSVADYNLTLMGVVVVVVYFFHDDNLNALSYQVETLHSD